MNMWKTTQAAFRAMEAINSILLGSVIAAIGLKATILIGRNQAIAEQVPGGHAEQEKNSPQDKVVKRRNHMYNYKV